ncbi:MAG: 3'-5' exonuclease, partial [Patescibacteria group bacterium]
IYSWRGANIRNILNFEKDYPGAKLVVLEENYRSTQTILAIANRIIEKNKMRRPKTLFTANALGEKVSLFEALNELQEASFVVEKIKSLAKKGPPLSEMAVLYRANFQSRALEEACLKAGVPYQVVGTRFFERKEIKDVISFIRYALNPESTADLARIINVPPRGIGKVTLLKIVEGQEEGLPVKIREKVFYFRKTMAKIKESALTKKPSETVKFVIEVTGLGEALSKSEEEMERVENLKELIVFAARYDTDLGEDGIESFLSEVALVSDQDAMKDEERVRLMTVHASKGLEFETVFITGLEEGLFPSDKDRDREVGAEEAEEERRLFYVALTRAKKKIFLTYAQSRAIYGSRGINIPSEFIFDIPEEHIEREYFDYLPKRKPLLDIRF